MLYQPLPALPFEKPLAGTFLGSVPPLPVPQFPGSGGGPAWGGGVALPSFLDVDPGGWPGAPCVAEYEDRWIAVGEEAYEQPDKAITTTGAQLHTFDPFIVYHLLDDIAGGCSGLSSTPDQQDRFEGYVRNWMDVQASAGVAQAFYRGAPADGLVTGESVGADGIYRNPTLRTYATDLTADMGTPASVHPVTAVANLLAAYYGCKQAGGAVLHVPPLILPFLIAHGVVAQVGQRFLGPGGVVVISDPGMPSGRDLLFDGVASDSAAWPGSNIGTNFEIGDGECWMFVSGPVQASVGELREPLDGQAQVFDVRQNRWMYVLEQAAIFVWDPACAFAVATFAPSPGRDEV